MRRSRRTNTEHRRDARQQREQQHRACVARSIRERQVHERTADGERERCAHLGNPRARSDAVSGCAAAAASPSVSPAAPAGRLTRKISRHPPIASKAPPTAGPSASPSAWAVPWTPIARVSSGLGIASAISATLLAWSIAAPSACSTRAAISTDSDGASPHSAEPAVNTPKPYV